MIRSSGAQLVLRKRDEGEHISSLQGGVPMSDPHELAVAAVLAAVPISADAARTAVAIAAPILERRVAEALEAEFELYRRRPRR
jgi:hypothetical protein